MTTAEHPAPAAAGSGAAAGVPVSVIGLGMMGAGMAQRLLQQGVPVSVWNRTADRADALAERGASVAGTPAEAARDAGLVLVSVADGEATGEVLYGPAGVLADGPPAGVLVCTTTLAPAEITALAGRTDAVLDAGLVGNHRHAAQGELRIFVGGRPEVLAQVRPVLDLLGQDVRRVGPLGAGMRLKLVLNLLMGVEVQALAEAVALGTGMGLDRREVLDVITTVGGFVSPVMAFKARRLRSGDYSGPDFRLRLMAKDLRLADAEAAAAGAELPLVRAAMQAHDRAVALGLGEQDCAAIARVVAQPCGRAEP